MNTDEIVWPQSRSDRKGFWARFSHPVDEVEIRVDLGKDRDEAALVCDDLNAILRLPQTWDDRHHHDLDGLNEKALDAFFGRSDRVIAELRRETLLLKLEAIELRIGIIGVQVEMIWMFTDEYMSWMGWKNRSELRSSRLEAENDDRFSSSLVRYGCPDGTVVYGRGREGFEKVGAEVRREFGRRNCSTKIFSDHTVQKRFISELKALYGNGRGGFEIPLKPECPIQRFNCIYRIQCRDDSVHFADGCVAYDALYLALRESKGKLKDCLMTAERSDRLKPATLKELKALYPSSDGGYAIPFPDLPPKRKRKKKG